MTQQSSWLSRLREGDHPARRSAIRLVGLVLASSVLMVAGLSACSSSESEFTPPTPETTGWQPAGDSLRPYTGPTTIIEDYTVLEGVDISSNLIVEADNVTVRRSRISGGSDYVVLQTAESQNLTLDQVEVTSASGKVGDRAIASFGTGLTVNRSYVHNTQRGIAVGDGTVVTDSYIDDLYNSTENHATAIAAWGNIQNVTLRRNTLGCGTGMCSSAISVYPEQGPNSNWTIDGNLFNGGSYCLYLGYSPSAGEQPNTDMNVTNNSFGTKYNPECGVYGPVGSWSNSPGNTWTGNTWYAPGEPKDGMPVENPGD